MVCRVGGEPRGGNRSTHYRKSRQSKAQIDRGLRLFSLPPDAHCAKSADLADSRRGSSAPALPEHAPCHFDAIQAAGLISAHIDLVKAAVLGMVEGLTEYLPVSSTGHLLLMERVLGWGDDAFGKSFAILIQLGAILALLTIYFGRLWALAKNMFTEWAAARFVIGVLLAFLPAAVIGALAYAIIKAYLFDVRVVCISLIIGGFVLLWVDRLNLKPRYHEATGFTLPMYFGIGVCQCLSMIPGVSRAGATIVGAMLFGADRRSAAEFSFWLAMPTMVGAFAYEAYKRPRRACARQSHRDRRRLRVLVHLRLDRGEDVPALRAAPRLRAVRLVAHHGRHHRPARDLFCA